MDGFECLKKLCKIDECVKKNNNENSDKGYYIFLN